MLDQAVSVELEKLKKILFDKKVANAITYAIWNLYVITYAIWNAYAITQAIWHAYTINNAILHDTLMHVIIRAVTHVI